MEIGEGSLRPGISAGAAWGGVVAFPGFTQAARENHYRFRSDWQRGKRTFDVATGAARVLIMQSENDAPSSRSPNFNVDKREFFFPGSELSVLLIHGLTGTPYEMRYLGERLAAAGFRVKGGKLAGDGGGPRGLGGGDHAHLGANSG